MNRILQRTSTPLLTSAQLQALIGQPHETCPVCGSIEWAVTHRGEWLCCDCDPTAFTAKGIAILLRLVDAGDDRLVTRRLEDCQKEDRLREDITRAGGLFEIVNGVPWVGWRSADGHTCYCDLVNHDPDRIVALIASGRALPGW